MFWPLLTAACLVFALGLHLWWRREFRIAGERSRAALERLEREQNERVLRLQAQQESVFNAMGEGVLLLDDAGMIVLANRALREMAGATGDIRGKSLIEAFRIHDLAELAESLQTGTQTVGREIKMQNRPDAWLEVNGSAIFDSSGARHGVVLVFHDLTKVKRLENARTEFVANVSHELRTPLSLIKGYVEALLDGANEEAQTRVKFLKTIERNTERLRLLIEDLLTISEMESGLLQLQMRAFPLRPFVSKIVEEYRTRAEGRDVELVEAVGSVTIRADANRLEQVFGNLLDNAIKYGRQNGRISIGTGAAKAGLLEIYVKDDGPGIPEESIERVFERFYRVDKARSRDQGGTGLGLSIVKHIVQSHGGRVWAKSKPGEGATFWFTVPIDESGMQDRII